MWNIKGKVIRGHQVASGAGADTRFPGGTLKLQWPLFQARGIDLTGFYPGTINVSIKPFALGPLEPLYNFKDVKWTDEFPPEDFSFFDARLRVNSVWYDGYIYYPHPETKPDHHQDPSTVELLMPRIPGVEYDMDVRLESNSTQSALVCP